MEPETEKATSSAVPIAWLLPALVPLAIFVPSFLCLAIQCKEWFIDSPEQRIERAEERLKENPKGVKALCTRAGETEARKHFEEAASTGTMERNKKELLVLRAELKRMGVQEGVSPDAG